MMGPLLYLRQEVCALVKEELRIFEEMPKKESNPVRGRDNRIKEALRKKAPHGKREYSSDFKVRKSSMHKKIRFYFTYSPELPFSRESESLRGY